MPDGSIRDPALLITRMARAWEEMNTPYEYGMSIGTVRGSRWKLPDIYFGYEDEPFLLAKCFCCGVEGLPDVNKCGIDNGIRSRPELWDAAFHGRHSHEWAHEEFCDKCAKRLPKIILQFVDIDELKRVNNYLLKAINEKRN